MWMNYLLLAIRNLRRTPGYSFINVIGLTIGLTCCLFLFLFVTDDLSYDQFNVNKDRIYRVVFSTSDDRQPTNANGSYGTGPSMANDFAEVEKFTRVNKPDVDKVFVSFGDEKFNESGFVFADSTFFEVFSFPLRNGDARTVLRRPNTIVINETLAAKYFKGENSVGKSIDIDFGRGELVPLEITGVMEDFPSNSHIKASMITSIHTRTIKLDEWQGFDQVFTYVLLRPSTNAADVNARLIDYSKKYMGPDAWYQVSLQPLVDIHLKSALRSEFEPNGSWTSVYIFSAIAVIVLVIACINFTMLATARSLRRSKEVGLRKTLGAQRLQLIGQFVGESFMFSLIAGLMALVTVQSFLAAFNEFTGKTIVLNGSILSTLLIFTSIVVVVTTLLAGFYPAIFLSGFKPAAALRVGSARASLSGLRKTLVVVQFTISIILLSATFIVFQQMEFVKTASRQVGDGIVVLPMNRTLQSKYYAFKDQLMQIDGVKSVAAESILPSKGSSSYCYEVAGSTDSYCAYTYLVDPNFLSTHGYKIVAGRDLSYNFASDTVNSFILNREAVRELGYKSNDAAVGTEISIGKVKGRVVGVMENFSTWSLRDSVAGTIVVGWKPNAYSFLSIKFDPAKLQSMLSKVENAWSNTTEYPFDYFFLDESFAAMHQRDLKTGQTLSLFAVLAICISCLGMVGLVSYTTEQRTKEIGIRKTLGASVSGILMLVTKDFLLLIFVAFAIAAPAVWKLMSTWLQGFAYHVEVSPLAILLGGFGAVLLAVISVAYNSWKAAAANPVNALRVEN